MNTQFSVCGISVTKLGFLGALALTASGIAMAAPDKAATAATADKGTGCLVRDADGNYTADPECTWHNVIKRDENGALVSYIYQDIGTLPEGAPHPDKAQIFKDELAACNKGSKETVTPNGGYTSNCHFQAK